MNIEDSVSFERAAARAKIIAQAFGEEIEVVRADSGLWLLRGSNALAQAMELYRNLTDQGDADEPPEAFDEPYSDDEDDHSSYDEFELSRQELMDDIASDQEDWARSDEDGWFYGDDD